MNLFYHLTPQHCTVIRLVHTKLTALYIKPHMTGYRWNISGHKTALFIIPYVAFQQQQGRQGRRKWGKEMDFILQSKWEGVIGSSLGTFKALILTFLGDTDQTCCLFQIWTWNLPNKKLINILLWSVCIMKKHTVMISMYNEKNIVHHINTQLNCLLGRWVMFKFHYYIVG